MPEASLSQRDDLFCDSRAVAAFVFGAIERGVTCGVERALRFSMRRAGCYAEADCNRPDILHQRGTNDITQALCRSEGIRFIYTGEQQSELFAAQTRSRVVVARKVQERAGDVANHAVAC